MNSKLKHSVALKRNREKCQAYKANGTREINKAKKQAKIAKRLAKAKARKEALV